mgnify:CR=1 FL=1|jgi:hypothetical protein
MFLTRKLAIGILLAAVIHPCAFASTTENGLTSNGMRLNGVTLNGMRLNGLTHNGVRFNGLTRNGVRFNAMTVNGARFNALTQNALTSNGQYSALEQGVNPLVDMAAEPLAK